MLPLNQVAVPESPNLYQYVTNKVTARKLGKALFWDMQVGSDGLTACASCHFRAGVDNRMKNTVNPGTRAGDTTFQVVGPNGTLQMSDFPFHQRQAPGESQSDPVIRNSNDVVGSQGVRFAEFAGIIPGSAVEQTIPISDPVFNVDGVNMRRVTGRNAPSVINAIFNFTNFWDGRAHSSFNGVNPFGPADPDAGIWFNDPQQGLVKRKVALTFGSLASLSTGPALDDTEMSARGRTFPELARKLFSLVPLCKQLVHREDSELGALSRMVINPDGSVMAIKGLNTSYAQLIRDSFHSDLWDSGQPVTVILREGQTDQFTHMEANFSFFWGVSIQLYLATLVSDQTPFDHWLGGDDNALTEQQKEGFALFSGIGKCSLCHGGVELTNASVANSGFINNDIHFLIDLMFVADGNQVIYDTGFNNTAVTLTTDDISRGANAPFVNTLTSQLIPLSFSHLAELQMLNLLPFPAPIMPPGIPSNMRLNKNGAFKVPSLRNVELTAPYFHNGSIMSLEDMMDFLIRGGNFPDENIADLDPDIGTGIQFMRGDEEMKQAVIAYLMSLTDLRVGAESGPFDHPELFLPNGDPEILIHIPARNSNGAPLPSQVLALNAVISPTVLTSQTISGTVEAGLTPVVAVDAGAIVDPVSVNGTDWSVLITDLQEGDNVITVSVVDLSSVQTTLTEIITVVPDSTPVFTSIPGTQAEVGELYIYEATVTDPLGDIMEYSLITAPSGMTVYPDWGLVLWTPGSIQVGQHRVSLKVTDANALFSIQDFTITVSPVPDLTIPGAPTAVTAVRGNAQAAVSFTPPAPNGSSAITSYKVTSSPGGIIKAGSASPITVTGLKNGTSYTFTVAATNAKGTGPFSLSSNAVTPATIPGAPTAVNAVRGNTQATVRFTTPSSNGGAPITSYTVTSSGTTAVTATGANSPLTVTGLTNGKSYTFTVKATNAVGTGPASAASPAVTPATVPAAPAIVTVTAGVLQAKVAFTPPSTNGGSAITGYTVTSSPGGIEKTGTASPITVTGLAYDAPYTFTVTAKNAVGSSLPSAESITVTPTAAVPKAPTAVTATRGNMQATVSFTPPVSNGGTEITGYIVTSSPGGKTANGTASPLTVSGLTNGTAYTFTVKAKNAIGSGPASAASKAVTPATVPNAPSITRRHRENFRRQSLSLLRQTGAAQSQDIPLFPLTHRPKAPVWRKPEPQAL
ncbi:MAG: fibronectin type III domain-containing protein [Victivallales bacterium]|jgi:cytochrome c peroxidase